MNDAQRDKLIAQFTRFITNLPGQDKQSAANKNFRKATMAAAQTSKAKAAAKAGGNTARANAAVARAKAKNRTGRANIASPRTTTTTKGGKVVKQTTVYPKGKK